MRTAVVGTQAELNAEITALNAVTTPGQYTIKFANGIGETANDQQIELHAGVDLTIDGADDTLNGGGAYRGLYVYAGDVTIENLTIANAAAIGGAGSDGPYNVGGASGGGGGAGNGQLGINSQGGGGGGGGAGLGGGLFVAAAGDATLENVSFSGNSALGGAGGQWNWDRVLTNGPGGGGAGGFGGGGAGGEGGQNGGEIAGGDGFSGFAGCPRRLRWRRRRRRRRRRGQHNGPVRVGRHRRPRRRRGRQPIRRRLGRGGQAGKSHGGD